MIPILSSVSFPLLLPTPLRCFTTPYLGSGWYAVPLLNGSLTTLPLHYTMGPWDIHYHFTMWREHEQLSTTSTTPSPLLYLTVNAIPCAPLSVTRDGSSCILSHWLGWRLMDLENKADCVWEAHKLRIVLNARVFTNQTSIFAAVALW